MNKTHGFASAWMLGSGLLLNMSLTAHAEELLPLGSDEYLIPQRSPATPVQKAPRLLPEVIRNAEASPNNRIVRPLAPANSSLSAGRKMTSATPLSSRPASRSVVVPANLQRNGAMVQTVAEQSDTTASPIQKQLEDLYRKDGRPMPQMNFNQTPVPASGQAPVTEGTRRSNSAAPSNVVPPKPRTFFEKINPFNRTKTAPAPLPQHAAKPIPVNPARAPQKQLSPAPMSNGVNPAGANQNSTNRLNNSVTKPLPIPQAAQSAPIIQPRAVQLGSQLPDTLPPVPGDPGYQGASAKSLGEVIVIPPAPASVDDALENAFSDKSAAQSEGKVEEQPAPKVEAKSLENESPFSGLSLDDEFGPASKSAATKSDKTATNESASEPKSIELPNGTDSDIPLPPAAKGKEPIQAAARESAPAEAKEPAKDEVQWKMKLIAERGELRGLKGFCPVTLRDERDLKNALPEHHSTFKGRTYYFSSADAKVVFDEHPQQYAPISGGQDVVLLKEKVTKEGSLDHAVWFKDRLYLFTSQKTLEQFVATPKEFAISE
ncbi:MAG: hypothetical protein ACKV2Q_00565 [Planctomycetaceae bacterium]